MKCHNQKRECENHFPIFILDSASSIKEQLISKLVDQKKREANE